MSECSRSVVKFNWFERKITPAEPMGFCRWYSSGEAPAQKMEKKGHSRVSVV
ncbi:MAG: hypothetical protein NDI81_12135 [Desulfobacula sp.]|nr:hypothetical protein [Desulfobacula sp.]MDA8134902.1 hypothetical protein [Desulfobacteraceae bacterium]